MSDYFKEFFSKLNFIFNNVKSLLVFLLMVIGVLIPAFSGSETSNFWYRLSNILDSPVYNMLLFLSIGINLVNYMGEMMNNYMVISRINNFSLVVRNGIKDLILFTVYLVLISFILAISGAIIFSFGDILMIKHSIYDMALGGYILFFLIRSIIIACLVNLMIFLIYIIFNKRVALITILINGVSFLIMPTKTGMISSFLEMGILPYNYYEAISYSTFGLEIIVSIIEILILICVFKFLLRLAVRKKRDLI